MRSVQRQKKTLNNIIKTTTTRQAIGKSAANQDNQKENKASGDKLIYNMNLYQIENNEK